MSKKRITIASVSCAEYSHFLQGMMVSGRDKPQSKEKHAWLGGYLDDIAKPKREYGLTERYGMGDPFRTILPKPLLPRCVSGCDLSCSRPAVAT